MTTSSINFSSAKSPALRTILAAGLPAGALDLGFVLVLYGLRGVSPEKILHGIAAGAVGREAAVNGGLATAALGFGAHFVIALGAAAVFYAASRRLHALIEWPWLSGPLYGVAVWLFMKLVVLPLSATPPKLFLPPDWHLILLAHLTCVGLPIALVVRWLGRTSADIA